MKCLTNEIIQLLIDNQLEDKDKEAAIRHMEVCETCRSRIEHRQRLVHLLKASAPKHNMGIEIPAFIPPKSKVKKKINVKRILIWANVAAIALVLFFLKNHSKESEKPQPAQKEIVLEHANLDMDANTAYQNNVIITTITDENGNTVKCVTN